MTMKDDLASIQHRGMMGEKGGALPASGPGHSPEVEPRAASPAKPSVPNAGRTLAWVDGANSAVMVKLMLADIPGLTPVHVDLGKSVHADSHRFINDLERWYDRPIVRIKSSEFADIDAVFEKRKYHAGNSGAPCTGAMKFVPRLNYQLPSDMHLWGYTADWRDVQRFNDMVATYPAMKQRSPLIEKGLTKAACHAMLANAGIRRPLVYDLGFPNGNCIGCVKASSPDYWSLVRKHFPEVFARRADQSRRFGSRLARINDERIFIDEIPADWPTTAPIVASCDFLCQIAEQDLAA